jgi:protoheme IX farnesyltransferase
VDFPTDEKKAARAQERTVGAKLRDCVVLTSPGVTVLALAASFCGVWAAAHGVPDARTALFALFGIALASSGASMLNDCFDRDIDAVMHRTGTRPLPCGRISSQSALVAGIALCFFAVLLLAVAVNALAAGLTLCAIVVYTLLYTVLLKRRTPHAAVIGGLAGALLPVIGWVSVRGRIEIEAAPLFLVLFFWQPPHFWALALRHKFDYARAGIPVLPLVTTKGKTLLYSALYVLLLVAASELPYLMHRAGAWYAISVGVLGVAYLVLHAGVAWRARVSFRTLFVCSIVYLTVLLLLIAISTMP